MHSLKFFAIEPSILSHFPSARVRKSRMFGRFAVNFAVKPYFIICKATYHARIEARRRILQTKISLKERTLQASTLPHNNRNSRIFDVTPTQLIETLNAQE